MPAAYVPFNAATTDIDERRDREIGADSEPHGKFCHSDVSPLMRQVF